MKRSVTLLISIILSVGMLVLGVVPKMQAQAGCTLATLNGSYGVRFTGFSPGTTPPVPTTATFPITGVGTFTFNGAGGYSANGTQSNNGTIITFTDTGTYTVNPDCTGSIVSSVNPTNIGNFVIVATGTQAFFISTNPGSVQSGVAILQ